VLPQLHSLWQALSKRRDFEQGLNEELRFHIEQRIYDLVRSGVKPEEAARRAQLEFGGLNSVEEECRQARGLHIIDELRRQLGHAARLLFKTPRFTATALMTLAVCLGANLTIFAAIDAILVRPLPFPEAARLVTIYNTYPKAGVDRDGSSATNYYERRGQIPAFASLALYSFGAAVVGEVGSTERQQIARVTPEFFSTLGVTLAKGRTFSEDETSYKADKAVILADSYWRQHMQTAPRSIGKQIRVDGVPHTVIGILPPGFRYLSSTATLYFPFSSRAEDRTPLQRHSGGNAKHLVARLVPGATVAQAQAQVDAQNAVLEATNPHGKAMADAGFRSVVAPLHEDHVQSIRPALLWMQAGALVLLLIGSVNLTNLLLIRASSRMKEVAVRQALGASRMHVISEVVVETTLLTLAGGLLGLGVGAFGIRLLTVLGTDRLPLGSRIVLDERLCLIALGGAVLLGLLLALPIAWFYLRGFQHNAVSTEARGGTANRAAQGLRHGFIVAQIALALVLSVAAGLLALSLEKTMAVSPGFRPDHVLTGQISVSSGRYASWPARLGFNERLFERIRREPGVSAVGIVNNVPLSGNVGKSAATVKGHAVRAGESPRGHYGYGVDGDYFAAMGFFLREGRFLDAADSRGGERVCVVDEDFARYYWPNASPLGQRLFSGSEEADAAQAFTVVGVVGAVKQAGLADPAAQGAIYYPYALRGVDSVFVVVRTSRKPELLARALQNAVRSINGEVPVSDIRSMDSRIADSLVTSRSPALIAGLFSLIAIFLTAVGTYGVLSYAVLQRRREIGLRMALGARPGQIRDQFLGLALRLLAAGTGIGIVGAWLTGEALRTLLFQVSPLHIPTFTGMAAVIGAVSLLACWLPSRRAAQVSPMEALADQ
jgi:predicted permease